MGTELQFSKVSICLFFTPVCSFSLSCCLLHRREAGPWNFKFLRGPVVDTWGHMALCVGGWRWSYMLEKDIKERQNGIEDKLQNKKYAYLFIYNIWLCQVSIEALGIFLALCRICLLWYLNSLVVPHWLVSGILVPWPGIRPACLALQSKFLTSVLPGMSLRVNFIYFNKLNWPGEASIHLLGGRNWGFSIWQISHWLISCGLWVHSYCIRLVSLE